MMFGANQGMMTGLRRVIASAMAQDLCGFVVPGPDVARARGLDIAAAGLHLAATPRHANVLVVVGPLPTGLSDAATVAYAQMPRPRAILALGTDAIDPLPNADVTAPLTQAGLVAALSDLRDILASGAFRAEISDFDAPALQTRVQYTCPMHPEVVSDEPGSCPICGMTLMPKETNADGQAGHSPQNSAPARPAAAAAPASHGHKHDHSAHATAATPAQYTCPMHPEVVSDEPGSCPICGMHLVPADAKPAGHEGHGDHVRHGHKHDHGGHNHSGHNHSAHTAAATPAQYTCPMHPEVVSDEPGSCPICGMHLVPADEKPEGSEAHGDHAHHGHKHDHGGHNHSGHNHSAHTAAATPAQYTCPMHPEVVSDEPGSCPICGMHLVPADARPAGHEGHGDHAHHGHKHGHGGHDHGKHTAASHDHAKHDHAKHDHAKHDHDHAGHGAQGGHTGHGAHSGGPVIEGIEPHFMSMVDLTRDMPASADGLRMEWIELPFGPFFPGLPSGLGLTLTLDGDAVAKTQVHRLLAGPIAADGMTAAEFVDHFAGLSPLSPDTSRHLACLALENAAGVVIDKETATARAAAVERERIASHLGWLASLATQTGLVWMERRATALQLLVQTAPVDAIAAGAGPLRAFLHRLCKTPLLRSRLAGMGSIARDDALRGPVARAQGMALDARADDPVYGALGFEIVTQDGGDALARLYQRCGEIGQSLDLIARAKSLSLAQIEKIGGISGTGEAVVETPRGAARLAVELDQGKLISATYDPPCAAHIEWLGDMIQDQEIADALVAINSLDLSPWGLPA